MPARVAARVELEGVRVFLDATSASQKAFAILGASAIAAAATVTAAMAGLVSAVATVGTMGTKSAASFEQAMKRVQAVGGTTGNQTVKLSDDILRMSQNYEFSAVEVAQASEEIIKSGVAADDAGGKVLKAALNLALLTKGEMSTAKAATFVAGSMTAWGLEAKDVDRITNAVTAAANASAISVNDVARSLQQVTAVADFAGMRIEDVTTMIAIMGQEYMRNSDAGTSMKQMMLKLMAPTKKAAQLMNDYGISLKDSNGNALPLIDVFGQLNAAFGETAVAEGKLTKAEQERALVTIFGSDAVRAAAVAAMAGVPGYQKMANEIGATGNSAEEMAGIIQSALIPRLKMLLNIVSSFGISFGGPIVKALGDAVNGLNESLRSFDFKKFEVLGQFLVDIVTNGQASSDALRRAFGSDIADTIVKFTSIFTKLRDVVVEELIPALLGLKAQLIGEKATTQVIGDAFVTLGDMIRKSVSVFADFVTAVTLLAQELPKLPAKINELTTSLAKMNEEFQKNQALVRALELVAMVVAFNLIAKVALGAATAVAAFGTRLLIGVISFGKWVSGAGGLVASFTKMTDAFTLFGMFASKVFSPITTALLKVGLTAQFVARTLIMSFGNAASVLAAIFTRLGTSIVTVVNVFRTMLGLGMSLSASLTAGFRVFMGFLPTIVAMLGRFPVIFMAIRTAAVGVFAAIVGGSGGTILIIAAIVAALAALYIFWPQISAAVSAFVTNALTYLGSLWQYVITFAQGIYTSIAGTFQQIWAVVGPVLEIIAYAIGIVLVTAIAVIVVALYGLYKIVEMVVTGVVLLATEIYKLISGLVASASGLAQFGQLVLQYALKPFVDFGKGVSDVFNYIAGVMPQIVNQMLKPLNDFMAGLAAVWKFVGDVAPGIRDIMRDAFISIIDWVVKFLGVAEKIDPALAAVRQAAQQALDGITQTVNDTAENITKAIDNAKTSAETAAKGIADSFSNNMNIAGTAVSNFASDAIANFGAIESSGIAAANNVRSAWEGTLAASLAASSAAASGQDIPQLPIPRTGGITPRSGASAGSTPIPGGGGGGEFDWEKFFNDALRSLPLMNKELSSFLGSLAKDAPSRAQPMIKALMGGVNAIKAMAAQKAKIVAIDMAIWQVQRNITRGQIELNRVNLEIRAVELRYAGQILALQNDLLNVQWRIAQLQNEINDLQRENVGLARERVILEQQILPTQQRIAQIDREIEKLGREDAKVALEKAKMYQAVLPALQKQQQLERAISQVHNKQLELLNEEQNIRLKISDIGLTGQLRSINKGLDAAWGKMDVTKILDLEKQREVAETQQAQVQEQMTALQEQIELQGLRESLVINGLEQEKLAVDLVVQAYEDKLFIINQTQEIDKANRDVLIAQLQVEKQALEDTIQPMLDRIFYINQEIAVEQSRNALRVFDLQQEVINLQKVAQQIQFNIQTLQLQMANETLQMQQRALQLEQYLNEEEQKKAALEEARMQQEQVFMELIAGFLASMTQSGAFSKAEAMEVAKRLGLWDDSIAKIFELEGEYGRLTEATNGSTQATNDYAAALRAIPTYIEIVIKTIYEYEDRRASGGPVAAGNAYTVGERGTELFVPNTDGVILPAEVTANLAKDIAPATSRVLDIPSFDAGFTQIVNVLIMSQTILEGMWTEIRGMRADNAMYAAHAYEQKTIYVETNYNVDATYANQQSPSTIAQDLRAMQMMVNR